MNITEGMRRAVWAIDHGAAMPSNSTMARAQKAGLIAWQGYVRGIHHPRYKVENDRGWELTAAGKRLLAVMGGTREPQP